MNQKDKIMLLIKERGQLTKMDISLALYGDKKHMSHFYIALKKLVDSGVVKRTGYHPSYYSLSCENYQEIVVKKATNDDKSRKITNELIEEENAKVEATDNYGAEDKLITKCLKECPSNTSVVDVAFKIGLIDITNSTNISRYKSRISVVELAQIISLIPNIDERIKNGDPEVVSIIAKANGKINLFSFASKYCCYHNKNLYGRDDYSIFDTVLKNSLPEIFSDIKKSTIKHWVKNHDYKSYNDYITNKLDELGITILFRKRKFDRFIWYNCKMNKND